MDESQGNDDGPHPQQPASYIAMVQHMVETKPDDIFSTWYDSSGKASHSYTYQQLWDEAARCAHLLQTKLGVRKGERVVLCYDFGLHFFAVFLGCLRSGITAAIVYPPGPPLLKSLAKMEKVIEDCSPVLILTQSTINLLRLADLANPISKSRSLWPSNVKFHTTDKLRRKDASDKDGLLSNLPFFRAAATKPSALAANANTFDDAKPSDIAFLQYTSGSTGNPKGVMVTHGALAANVTLLNDSLQQAYKRNQRPWPNAVVGFSWLPQYHDMGLIQMTLAPLAGGWRMHMMSPISFIRNPLLWMDLMSKHKCNVCSAPDFAYQLVSRKFIEMKDEQVAGSSRSSALQLDLSHVVSLQNAAEPIRLDTMAAFNKAFSPYGLPENWFLAGYGLAEHVVGCSYHDRYHLSSPRPEDLQQYVAVGHPSTFHDSIHVIIVDPTSFHEVPTNTTGEVWLASPSVAAGYYGKPELSEEVFRAKLRILPTEDNINRGGSNKTYLRTGDLGFFQDGYLYICGRNKDLIIVDGVNYYPQDIEHAVQDASSAVRPGCVAAFSSDETGKDGQLEIIFELRSNQIKEASVICELVKSQIVQQIGLVPSRIVAIAERAIAKTTSGKIQRRHNRELLHANKHKIVWDVVTHRSALDDGSYKLRSPIQNGDDSEQRSEDGEDLEMNAGRMHPSLNRATFDDIVASITGSIPPSDQPWADIGLSSMAELELRNQLSRRFSTTLPENCFELFPTPADLKTFVESMQGQMLPVKLEHLQSLDDGKVVNSHIHAGIQFVCVFLILTLFVLPIVPTYELGMYLYHRRYFTTDIATIKASPAIFWVLLFPLLVPVWVVSLSLLTVATKWLVIGKYKAGTMYATSFYFIRWWFVDRLVHFWEFFVGTYIAGTPLMNLFYTLMGCSIHPSTVIDSFIREFDLIKVGQHCSIQQPIRCRIFGPWKDDRGATLRLRPIVIEDGASVKGVLCPGAVVNMNSTVSRMCVVREGGQVPRDTTVAGNPGFIVYSAAETTPSGHINVSSSSSSNRWRQFNLLKLLWLTFELYFIFGVFVALHSAMQGMLLPQWRYQPLVQLLLFLCFTTMCLVISSIVFKWALIGRKRPGPFQLSLYSEFVDWAVDYHFRFVRRIFYELSINSRLWNIMLMAHGMDIDLDSKVYAKDYPPSKLDLITIKRSLVSTFAFDVKTNDGDGGKRYERIVIEDSSVGWCSVIGAGVTVKNTLVPPQTLVTDDLMKTDEHPRRVQSSTLRNIRHEIEVTLLHMVIFMIAGASLIPTFEVWINLFDPLKPLRTLSLLVCSLIVQSAVWMVLLRLSDFAAFGKAAISSCSRNHAQDQNMQDLSSSSSNVRKNIRDNMGDGSLMKQHSDDTPWSASMYVTYHSLCMTVHLWWFVPVLWGTPMMKFVLRFLGSSVEGDRLLYFGFRVYEYPYVTFADRSVVDESMVAGHQGIFNSVVLGPCHVSGVLHRHCYVMANATSSVSELGPQQVLMASPEKKQDESDDVSQKSEIVSLEIAFNKADGNESHRDNGNTKETLLGASLHIEEISSTEEDQKFVDRCDIMA